MSLSCISMNNQACKIRSIINVNSNGPVFYPFSIKTSKCSGSCNNSNDPYAKMCVPGVVKNLEVKVFNLMSKTNDKYKELIDKTVCNRGYIWNPINCECECDKSCDIGEHLDHKNCKR